jgi:hypothetical protein
MADPIGDVGGLSVGYKIMVSVRFQGSVPLFSLVLENDVQGVNDTGNVTQNGQQDVDPEVCRATSFKEYSKRGEEDLLVGKEKSIVDVVSMLYFRSLARSLSPCIEKRRLPDTHSKEDLDNVAASERHFGYCKLGGV